MTSTANANIKSTNNKYKGNKQYNYQNNKKFNKTKHHYNYR